VSTSYSVSFDKLPTVTFADSDNKNSNDIADITSDIHTATYRPSSSSASSSMTSVHTNASPSTSLTIDTSSLHLSPFSITAVKALSSSTVGQCSNSSNVSNNIDDSSSGSDNDDTISPLMRLRPNRSTSDTASRSPTITSFVSLNSGMGNTVDDDEDEVLPPHHDNVRPVYDEDDDESSASDGYDTDE
jgi:hypothetical protein